MAEDTYNENYPELVDEVSREMEETPLLGLKITPSLEKAITDRVMGIKTSSEQFYQGRRNRWLDYFNHYMNRKREKTRTTIPMPMASEHVDVVLADTMKEFFSSEPLVAVKGRNLNDQIHAPAVEKLINYQYQQMDIYDIAYAALKSAYIYGSCPWRVVWDQRFVDVPIPGTFAELSMKEYSGPTILWYDIFDYFPDSSKVRPDDPAPHVVRMYRPYEYLVSRADVFPGMYFNLKRIPHKRVVNMQTDDLDARRERQYAMGMSPEATERGLVEIIECDMWWPVENRDGTYIAKPCVFTFGNGQLIRATRNPYVTQHGNMGLACPDRIPNDLFGVGLIEKMHPNIHGANTVLDMILTNLELSVDKQKVVSRDQVKNPEQVKRNYAGNVVWANGDARTAVNWIDGGDISADAYQMLAIFNANSESASGVKPPMKGEVKGSSTATANMLAHEESSSRFMLYLNMLSSTFFKPSAKLMHKTNQQFLDLPSVIPILDESTQDYLMIDSQTIASDPDFIVEAPQREANRQMEIAQIENFMTIVGGVEPLFPILPAIVGKLARAFRWDEAKQIEQLAGMAIQNYIIMSQILAAQQGGEQGGSSSPGGQNRQRGSMGNMAGSEAKNVTDLNQALLAGAGVSAFA